MGLFKVIYLLTTSFKKQFKKETKQPPKKRKKKKNQRTSPNIGISVNSLSHVHILILSQSKRLINLNPSYIYHLSMACK